MLTREKEPELDLFRWPADSEDKTDLEVSYEILNDLFNWYTPEDLKACLWVWLKTALENETEHCYAEARTRNLIFLYEHICDLTAAAYVIAREKKLLEKCNTPTSNVPDPQ
jgi:hypothetical protein